MLLLNPYRFGGGGGGIPSVLLMHFDGTDGSTTFTDEYGHTVTPSGNAQIDTAQSKFGGASAYFDGTGDYLSGTYTSDFSFGTGNFTIECWIYPTSFADERTIFTTFTTFQTGGGFLLDYDITTGRPRFFSKGTSALIATSGLTLNAWNHVAIVRAGSARTFYVNGTAAGSDTNSDDIDGTSLSNFYVGTLGTSGTNLALGYYDELRITKGEALYTANFTPPSAAFTE
jgi:hypothetical protein